MLAVSATGDESERRAAVRAWEEAGFGLEIAPSVQNALECLTVMTAALIVPTQIVARGKLYWPPRR